MTLRALAARILYRHTEIDKPGVGTLNIYTNRITLNDQVEVSPADIGPGFVIFGHAELLTTALRYAMVNAAMLRDYAARLRHEHPITSRY